MCVCVCVCVCVGTKELMCVCVCVWGGGGGGTSVCVCVGGNQRIKCVKQLMHVYKVDQGMCVAPSIKSWQEYISSCMI